jgi:hypothetical protein
MSSKANEAKWEREQGKWCGVKGERMLRQKGKKAEAKVKSEN